MEEPEAFSTESSNDIVESHFISTESSMVTDEPQNLSTESSMMTKERQNLSTESFMVIEEYSNILSDSSTVLKEPKIGSTENSTVTEDSNSEQDPAASDQSPICAETLTSQIRVTQFPYDKDTYKHEVINDRILLVENIISPLEDIFNFAAPTNDNNTIPPESDEDALFRMNAKSYFSSRVAVCEFFSDWISKHPSHALQQILRCMSYWRTRKLEFEQSHINADKNNDQNQRMGSNRWESITFLPVLVWPDFAYDELAYSKAKSFRRFNKTHDWRPGVKNEFTIGILPVDELASEFDVLITTTFVMVEDVYHRLLQIEKFQYQQFIASSGEHDNFTNPFDNKMYYGNDGIDYNVESYSILGTDYNNIKGDDSMYYLSDADYSESSSTSEVEMLQGQGNDEQVLGSKTNASLPEFTSQTREILYKVLTEATVTMKIVDQHFDSYAVHDAPSDVQYYTDRIKSKYNFTYNSQLVPKSVDDHFHSFEATTELYLSDTEIILDMEQKLSMCEQMSIIPRIGILNRRPESLRSLLNIDAIVDALETELLHIENVENCYKLGKISKPTVEVAYFEWRPFKEQIEFYSSFDIILTPHGAQETRLFFMPRCEAILEFFPKGYHIPWFFGNLARMSGIAHYTGYISDSTDIEEDLKHGYEGTEWWEQTNARGVNLCPQIPPIIAYMMNSIIQDWQKCVINRRSTRYQISHVL
jgi:Glycosyltransferase 61